MSCGNEESLRFCRLLDSFSTLPAIRLADRDVFTGGMLPLDVWRNARRCCPSCLFGRRFFLIFLVDTEAIHSAEGWNEASNGGQPGGKNKRRFFLSLFLSRDLASQANWWRGGSARANAAAMMERGCVGEKKGYWRRVVEEGHTKKEGKRERDGV